MKTVNSFLIKGESNVLIDTGENTEQSWSALQSGLAKENLLVSDIDQIIITHAHVDHVGMAARIAHESGSKVYVSKLVLPWVINLEDEWENRSAVMKKSFGKLLSEEQKRNFIPLFESFFGKVSDIWQVLSHDQVELFDMNKELDIAGKSYECIHCPGHTWTQTCFLNHESGDLFSADMLLKITPTCVIEPIPGNNSERNRAMPQLLDSYYNLLSKEIKTIYPGHYEVMTGHKNLIQKQLTRINLRRDQVHDLIKKGTVRYLDIFNELYGGRFNFPGLVMALGYLDMLIDESRIKEIETEDGIIFESID